MVVLDEHTEEHDFGWSFAAQTRSFAESRNPLDMAIGHGAVVVDRFTSAVWVTGSNQLDWLETYRATGNPRLNL